MDILVCNLDKPGKNNLCRGKIVRVLIKAVIIWVQ